ncbi:MAG: hypothetical protein U0893_20735 [Chloroflexota bacterium]
MSGERLQLSMLNEIFETAIAAADPVWPTPSMALGRLFERGATFLAEGAALPRLTGSASPELLAALHEAREDLLLVEALYPLTRHVTFVLTQAGAEREAFWVSLADRHMAIRAEIVECRRAEERLKRELRSLGGAVVPLPEHDDLPMSDGDRPRKSRGMYDHLFAGARVVQMELDVSPSALAAADRVVELRGWDAEWSEHARLLVLMHGISLALREAEADGIDPNDDASVQAAYEVARSRLMGQEGRYSTIRRRLFELRHNNRILEWRITALEVEARGMRSRLDQFLVDRERLEQAIAARLAAGAVPQAERQPSPEGASWRTRIGRLFGRTT